MVKIAILIQAHRNPAQVARLCDRLRHECVDIYLNIDLKSNQRSFVELIPWVTYVENRVNVVWGGFSQVQATLNALAQIQGVGKAYDYVMLTSGQDYPVVPIEKIVEQIAESQGKGYIFGCKLTNAKEDFYAKKRYEYYYCQLTNRLLSNVVNRLIRVVSVVKRKYPFENVYKGSSWWCLSGGCIDFILDFCSQNPDYMCFHKHAHCCDEYFFHNIVANSPFADNELRSEESHYVYMDWSEGRPNPRTFVAADFEHISTSGKWLVRKVDLDVSPELFDKIDQK